MYPGAHAASHPDKPALVIAETGWTQTFAELDAAANRLSRLFRAVGLQPGDHVALCMENHLNINVFNMADDSNINRIISGDRVGTLVTT